MRTLSLTIFGIGLVALFYGWSWFNQPGTSEKIDVEASNFIAYRSAVLRFATANPAFIGTADFASVVPYAPVGSVTLENYGYTNQVLAGRIVYVYAPQTTNSVSMLTRSSTDQMRTFPGIGYALAQRIVSPSLGDLNLPIPFAIPDYSLISYVRLHP